MASTKKIVVTGATGFLGSHLVKAFLRQRYQVIAIKRRSSNLARLEECLSDIQLYDWESDSLTSLFQEHRKIDAVVHTATCYGRDGQLPTTMLETNVALPLRLLERCGTSNIGLFINTDSILPPNVGAYALSKHHFREWARHCAERANIHLVNVKLEHIYGPEDDVSKFTAYVMSACMADIPQLDLTAGEQQRDFVYIDDVVSAFCLILEKFDATSNIVAQEYEVGSGKPISIRKFAELVRDLSGSNTYLNFGAVPYRANETMFSKANVEQLTALGWSCKTDLVEGLRMTIERERLK